MDCPYCKKPLRHVPAGVSKKTGKPFSAFYVCDNCGYTRREVNQKEAKQIGAKHILAALLEIRDILKEIRDKK